MASDDPLRSARLPSREQVIELLTGEFARAGYEIEDVTITAARPPSITVVADGDAPLDLDAVAELSRLASAALEELDEVDTATARKKNIARAIETVARQLGNTKAVCRRCYVHPAVLEHYLDGATIDVLRGRAESLIVKGGRHLSREETAVLALLHRRMSRSARGRSHSRASA